MGDLFQGIPLTMFGESEPMPRKKRNKHAMNKKQVKRMKYMRQPQYELNPLFSEGYKLVKRGVFGPSTEERLRKSKKRLMELQQRIEQKRLEMKIAELEKQAPKKKGLLTKILNR